MCTAAPGRVVGGQCVGGTGAGLEQSRRGGRRSQGARGSPRSLGEDVSPTCKPGGLPQRNPAPNLIPRLVLLPPDCPLSPSW